MKKHIIIVGILMGTVPFYSQKNIKKENHQQIFKKSDSTKESNIKEVIITSSYGTKKLKEEVVGSIATIDAKDINTAQTFESLDKMIAGIGAGVQIVNNPELGKPVNINIRGLGSLVNLTSRPGVSTQPLIIIDGIIMREDAPFDATGFDGGSTAEMNINPLARISTDNIETINILKDAAAVAIYGADAANGVILITTKKGKKGKPQFTLTSQYGVSQSINKIKYLNGEQYSQLYDTFLRNNGSRTGYTWNGVDVNWFDEMNKSGDYFKTNFSVSGGGKHITYRFGADYNKTNESKIMNTLEKRGLDANIGLDFNKLKINIYAAYNELDKSSPNTFFNFILAPTFPIYDANGDYQLTGNYGIANPLAAAHQNISLVKNKSLLSSINASYQILKNLKISTLFGIDISDKNNIEWQSGLNDSGRRNGTINVDGVTYNRFGRSRINTSDATKWNWSGQLFYEKDFANRHHIDVLAGMEIRENKDFKVNETGNNYINPNIYQLPIDAAWYYNSSNELTQNYTKRELTREDAGVSSFLQINYDFAKKYFFIGTIRRDQSSAFGRDRNAAYNGGIGLSWLMSNEKFLSNTDWIDLLRLRTSWGMTGNSRIGSYRSSGLYNIGTTGSTYDFPVATPDGSSPPNRELGWEKNEKYNIGLDFNFLKKFDFTVEFFRNNISDMIVNRSIFPESGYTGAEINGAAMYNQGWEFSARARWIQKKDFRWTTRFNISTLKNKITDLIGFGETYSTAAIARAQRIGTSTSSIWGYRWLGINPDSGQDIYMVNGVPTNSNNFTPSSATYEVIGNSQPDAYGGLTNSFNYKNFGLSFLINFEIGGDALVSYELIDQYRVLSNRNMSVNVLGYWTGAGDTTAINRIPSTGARIVPNSTKYIYDNTHVKLQNVNIYYRIPIEKKERTLVKDATIFLDVTNVAYWYKDKTPEGRNGYRELRYTYPEMRTMSLGFRVNF
ncbi:MAG: SusC/RagA family TonB-linked outer membrane protein [Cruoricaptor ignavus]|nr:SusC/RagA family TonB-linked outer membrane protein [Cruoricaptor ignavus]